MGSHHVLPLDTERRGRSWRKKLKKDCGKIVERLRKDWRKSDLILLWSKIVAFVHENKGRFLFLMVNWRRRKSEGNERKRGNERKWKEKRKRRKRRKKMKKKKKEKKERKIISMHHRRTCQWFIHQSLAAVGKWLSLSLLFSSMCLSFFFWFISIFLFLFFSSSTQTPKRKREVVQKSIEIGMRIRIGNWKLNLKEKMKETGGWKEWWGKISN